MQSLSQPEMGLFPSQWQSLDLEGDPALLKGERTQSRQQGAVCHNVGLCGPPAARAAHLRVATTAYSFFLISYFYWFFENFMPVYNVF